MNLDYIHLPHFLPTTPPRNFNHEPLPIHVPFLNPLSLISDAACAWM